MSTRPLLDFDLTGVHVLVVDDDADARDILDAVLSYRGALVSSVDSVRAALAAVQGVVPDVIVCDIAMPGESGYDLVCAIRRDARLRHIPVIAVTGYPYAAAKAYAHWKRKVTDVQREMDKVKQNTRLLSRNRAFAVGFKAYVEKPVDFLELCRTIRAVLLPP